MLATKSNQKTCFCKLCFRSPLTCVHSFITPNTTICYDCNSRFKPFLKTFIINGVKAFAIYPYDDFVKSNLYQLKGCYDIELAPIFLEYFSIYLNIKYFGFIVVPAPSFIDADEKRGFNHVQEIFKTLNLEQYCCIKKTSNVKQSDMNFYERQNIKNVLVFDNNFDVKNKNILLVDDVLTTGSTMKAMIELIKAHNPKRIEVLVMSMVVNKKPL